MVCLMEELSYYLSPIFLFFSKKKTQTEFVGLPTQSVIPLILIRTLHFFLRKNQTVKYDILQTVNCVKHIRRTLHFFIVLDTFFLTQKKKSNIIHL